MNIALEKTEEYVNGQKRRTYGDAFVRGNNGEQTEQSPPPPTCTLSHHTSASNDMSPLFSVMYISADG